ncbi:hypothetical protein A2U01_0046402, partial [Trifolium medium]|nr:hypothetical protein [Trifolium medium]
MNNELTLNRLNEFNVVTFLISSKRGGDYVRVLSQRGRRNFAEREKLELRWRWRFPEMELRWRW